MQACGRLVARMREQDVDPDIGAGIELDGGVMAPVMGDPGDPAIDDRYVAARQIGPDIGRNVVTIGEERQRVGPIVEQPDRIVRLRAGPDEAPMLAGDFKAVAIGAGHDGRAPAFGKARNIRHLVGDSIAQDQAARPKAFAIASEDGEIVDGAGDAIGPGTNQPDRGIARQLLPRLGQDVQRWLVIVAEQTMRVAGEAVARQAGIENGDLAAGTAELQGAGEAGKAAADDDNVIHGHGRSVLWMEGVGLGLARNIVQRYALETGSEQGFGIGEKVAHDCVDRPDDAAFIECIISEQPAIIPRDIMPPTIMPRPVWPVLVPRSSLPAVPFCAKTGTIRPPRPAASMVIHSSNLEGWKAVGESPHICSWIKLAHSIRP